MKIAIFGGSGKAGQYILNELLNTGHTIKSLVRNPAKINKFKKFKNLEIIQGDVLCKNDVLKTITNTDVVIVTIGHQKNSPPNLQLESIKIIREVMQKYSIKRILVLTGAGVYTNQDKPKIIDHLFKGLIKIIDPIRLKDAEDMVKFLTNSQLNWTIVRTHIHHSYKCNTMNIGYLGDKNIKLFCSRDNIAKFFAKSIEENLYIKDSPVISD